MKPGCGNAAKQLPREHADIPPGGARGFADDDRALVGAWQHSDLGPVINLSHWAV